VCSPPLVPPISQARLASCFETASARRQLLFEDRVAKIAGLDALRDAYLEDLENLLDRRPPFQRILDVPPGPRRVHVGERGVERDAQKLHLVAGQTARVIRPAPIQCAFNVRSPGARLECASEGAQEFGRCCRLLLCETALAEVVLGVEAGIHSEPLAHAPMIQLGRFAIGRNWTRIANTIFVRVRPDVGHFLSLAGRQAKVDRRARRLHRELTNVSGGSGAQERHSLLGLRGDGKTAGARQSERRR
jgi:hypothetical protein